MKAIQIEASKSWRKPDSQRSLRVARRLHSVLRKPDTNRIGSAVDKGGLKPTTLDLEEVCPCHS
jgi:hypothetical protein